MYKPILWYLNLFKCVSFDVVLHHLVSSPYKAIWNTAIYKSDGYNLTVILWCVCFTSPKTLFVLSIRKIWT